MELLKLLASVCLITVVKADLCVNPSEDELATHMTTARAPKAGTSAGVYQKIAGIDDFSVCVKACCEDPTCNAVFFSQKKCLTIQCKTDDGCSAGPKSEQLSDALLINLRTVAETPTKGSAVTVDTPLTGESHRSGDGLSAPYPAQSCEVDMFDCPQHEACIVSPLHSFRSRNGVCKCVEGYTRSPATGTCQTSSSSSSYEVTNKSETTPIKDTTVDKTATTTVPPTTPLTVSAGEDRVLTYPENSAKLTAYALPVAAEGETYKYHWTLDQTPEGDNIGQTSGIDEPTIHLTELIEGEYVLRVEVTGPHKAGSATVNVTVRPEQKVNMPPVAVIKPSILNVKEDTTGILDGADSTDDNKINKYLWEVVSGPIKEGFHLDNNGGSMLKLKGLSHGQYTIRLTVTDEQGETNSTMATVNVEEAVDYPPNANAGDDILITLPENSVNLNANASTDDKGIASYEWKSKSEGFSADIEGTHEPVLKIKHLREGAYTFELIVTDTKGQESTSEVHVYVKSSQNKPPIAAVVTNYTITVPGAQVVLDGSASSDDQLITKYQWSQVSGPNTAKLSNADRAKANVEGLEKGEYIFKLSVSDAEDLHNSTNVKVKVQEHSNAKPVARAGEDFEVTLPTDMVKIDGSKSTDDGGPLKYLWTKGDESPGAGDFINGSNTKAILLLTNAVPGTYTFSLRVTDQEGQQAEDSVSFKVHSDPEMMNTVELSLDTSIESFTEKHKKNLATQLALMLPSDIAVTETKVEITGIHQDYHSGKLAVLFLVKDYQSVTEFTTRNGTTVKAQIQDKLDRDSVLLGFTVSKVDTVVCQNDCSAHGYCDAFSKQCVCEPFWMPNYAKVTWNGESNCDWSILYVVVISLGSIFITSLLIWMCVCCSRRCKRTRGRRKHTYKLLQDIEEMENEEREAKNNKGKRSNITAGSGSIFMSETDLSSEAEDTLFMNGKTQNGKSQNGGVNLHKTQDNFVKANNLKNKFSNA